MGQDGQRYNTARRYKRTRPAVKLGDTLSRLMDNHISPRYQKFKSVAELWEQLLPAELARHCKIIDISGDQLKVMVDSPSYSNELRWCSSGILEQIQQQYPAVRIKTIKCVLG